MAAAVASPPLSAPIFHLPSSSDVDGPKASPQSPPTPSVSGQAQSVSPPPSTEMSSEVTALSNKLINAINYQTNLDDSLAAARQDLEESRDRVRQLEAVRAEHDALVADGILVRRTEMEDETVTLKNTIEDERRQRAVVEKEKKAIEQELENLTTALFEEANEMVAAARHERDAAERKGEQLRAQLKDTEILLASHQEQLAELKTVMQQMGSDRDEVDTNANHSTAPTSPLLGEQGQLGKIFDALHLCPNTPGSDDIPPSYPTSFSHLLQPVLRTDLSAFHDFSTLLRLSHSSPTRARGSTGAYSGLSIVGLGGFSNNSPSNSSDPSPANSSSPALTPGGTQTASPGPPSAPVVVQGTAATKDPMPLKETRFYKRVLTEDIEPTLRLDTAPGLSWLARRTVIASMSEGNLVVEPLPAAPSLRVVTCALCGERRRGEEYARTHQFKTNETENAQRYPLCKYCTSRVRATCDFLGFLRMIKDGHWRAEGDEGEKSAWEETVKLRERMFWSRIGGGVVPAFVQMRQSSRNSSVEGRAESKAPNGLDGAEDEVIRRDSEGSKGVEGDVFHSDERPVSIGLKVVSLEAKTAEDESAATVAGSAAVNLEEQKADTEANEAALDVPQTEHDVEESNTSEELSTPDGFSAERSDRGLSVTIPGSFD